MPAPRARGPGSAAGRTSLPPLWRRPENSQERNRREDRSNEPEIVPLKIPSKEQERERGERVAGRERRDGRPPPEPQEPPCGDGCGHCDLDRREREVRLPVRDHAQ